MTEQSDQSPAPTADQASLAKSALLCRCPRCGEGKLFAGLLSLGFREKCASCGLGFAFIDAGDGPAVFAILILGVLVLGGALIAEFSFHVPLWGHIVLWGLATPVIALGLLRVLKATLAALQYRYKAQEAGGAHVAGPRTEA
ncbi:MAG: DUF983 domain-containing protein [Proteobacteria bacterium]|nr:DUF983 domain-containing protein [Pseudomonadota bacterium]